MNPDYFDITFHSDNKAYEAKVFQSDDYFQCHIKESSGRGLETVYLNYSEDAEGVILLQEPIQSADYGYSEIFCRELKAAICQFLHKEAQ